MINYVVASCKPWHLERFNQISADYSGSWAYVSSEEELLLSVEKSFPKYIFFLHWNWIVPKKIWQNCECICFHMTDVPYGRGGSPLQNLILAGKSETKVTALRMTDELDAGPVYMKLPMGLQGSAQDIYLRAGEISWKMMIWIIENNPAPTEQQGQATYFRRRKPQQSCLPSKGGLDELYNFIRMLDAPTYPLAFIDYGDFRLEFLRAEIKNSEIQAQVVIRLKQGS